MTTGGIQEPTLLHPGFPRIATGGAQLPHVQLLPPTYRIAGYVRSGGFVDGDDDHLKEEMFDTLAGALAQVRAGRGDTVVVLPGHSEDVTDATMLDNLVAGTRIIGVGSVNQDDAPTFRWTNTAGSWVVNDKNLHVEGLRLRMEGVNGVVKAIDVTAAGFALKNCHVQTASGATAKATIAVEIGAGADECTIAGNYFRGTATHNSTNVVLVDAAVSNLKVLGNTAICSATAGNGIVQVTAAALNMDVSYNRLYNTHTSSTACIAFGNVACDGFCTHNILGTKNNGTANAQGVTLGAAALVVCAENYSVDEARRSGVLAPAVVAT